MTAPRDLVEEVKRRTDLLELVRADVELQPAGSVWKGLSPWNPEKTPSFVVWPDTQTWRDFSRGGERGGDVIDYVMARDGCEFRAALHALASRAGVRAPSDDPAADAELAEVAARMRLERLLTRAAAYYHRVLPSKIRTDRYRAHYGFTDATIDDLQLGWADGHLFEHLAAEGVPRDDALATGLFVVLGGGRVEDFFKDRLFFPYWRGGRVVYAIARAAEPYTGDEPWEQAKYKKLLTRSERHPYVSPLVGNDYFYNEDAARGAGRLLITEGVTDCISALQAGLPTISPVTTRFRERDVPKLVALTRAAGTVVVCNDSEASGAGEKGALETALALARAGRDARVATLPRPDGVDKIDVNEFLRARPVAELERVLDAAPPVVDLLLERIPADTPAAELPGRLADVLPVVAAANPAERDRQLDLLHRRFGLRLRTARELVARARASTPPAAPVDNADAPGERHDDTAFRGRVVEDVSAYFVEKSDGTLEQIASFGMAVKERIVSEQGELLKVDLRTDGGRVIRDFVCPRAMWHGRRELLRALPAPDLQWTGGDEHVQGVLRLLSAQRVPTRLGTQVLGYLETAEGPRWVAPDALLAPEGPRDRAEIVYLPSNAALASRLTYEPAPAADVRALAAEVLPRLLDVNQPAVVLPILGWFYATPFKPRLSALLGHFPILVIWGTRGSGKTSIVRELFWRLLGVVCKPGEGPFSATETEFATIRLLSSTNAIPVFIDEYKPRDMGKGRAERLHRLLRRVYGGETEGRGRVDLSVVHFALSAPVCLAGEARPEGDPALVERMISVTPNKNEIEGHAERKRLFGELRRRPLHLLAAPYIQFALGRDTRADLAVAVETADRLLAQLPEGADVPTRCRDNLIAMVLGLDMFERWAESLGVELPELDVLAALRACLTEVLDGDRSVKDPLDLFLEALHTYALAGALQEGRHYAVVAGNLCLHLPSCYEVYLAERRRTGREDDTNGLKALRRLVAENHERGGYVASVEKRVTIGAQWVRTVEIDLERVPDTLDVDEFPVSRDRTWGGARWRGSEPDGGDASG